MEMIDVSQKLREIAETKPELVKDAVDNVERTNPVKEGPIGTALGTLGGLALGGPVGAVAGAIGGDAMTDSPNKKNKKMIQKEGGMKDYLHDEAEKLSREEFIKKHGESLAGFWDSINGSQEATEGKIPAGLKAYQDKKAGKEKKDDEKETVKEAIQISTDSPQEASMMMQILKLAGVQQVDPSMMGMEPEHGSDMDPGAMNKQMDTPSDDDAMGTMQMAKMRDMMTAPQDEKAAETFANEPEEKVQNVDSLVNKHSGGLNRQKSSFSRAEPGDNPMTAEDKITEEELANSLRTQYENFKEAYHKKAKMDEAPKPDFLDMDKDGNKKEPMKKAVKDKEKKEAK